MASGKPPWWRWYEPLLWFPDWLHRRTCTFCRGLRRAGCAAAIPEVTPEQHGSTGQEVYGRLPEWPENWHRKYPLDPVVFGAVPRVRE